MNESFEEKILSKIEMLKEELVTSKLNREFKMGEIDAYKLVLLYHKNYPCCKNDE